MRTSNLAALALPLAVALALAGCGSQKADEVGQADASMTDEPGVNGAPVTQGQAREEATVLAGRLAAGDLPNAEAAVALEDLDRLVNDNIVDFPEAMRPELTQSIQSARTALESGDMQGLKQAASVIHTTLSASVDSTATGATPADASTPAG